MACPCKSGNTYINCCKSFHDGTLSPTALELMRSRFSAYVLNRPAYIIATTHPSNPQFSWESKEWSKKISEFCINTDFKNLEILHNQEKSPFATVTFVVHLVQNKKNVFFTETSYFEKMKDKWFYRSGQLAQGRDTRLIPTHPLRILPLAYYGHPILRKVADPIEAITPDLRALVKEMIETMDGFDGIGLAAPQIHHSIQLFIIRKPVEAEGGKIEFKEVKVFINPKLSAPSRETWKVEEGCLSIPSIQAEVERPKEITVEYLDLSGNPMKERVSGWEARVIMHENDHVNGILFIDHLEAKERQYLEPLLESLQKILPNYTDL